jgi:hypothetical protein
MGGFLRIRDSVTDLLSDPRSDTDGSAQVRGVATLQASPRIAHRLCLRVPITQRKYLFRNYTTNHTTPADRFTTGTTMQC